MQPAPTTQQPFRSPHADVAAAEGRMAPPCSLPARQKALALPVIAFCLALAAFAGAPCLGDATDADCEVGVQSILSWQLGEARDALRRIEGRGKGTAPQVLYLRAMLAYYEGRYADARDLLRSPPAGMALPPAWKELAALVESVYQVAQSFRETQSEHFTFRFTPRDEILSCYALDALERAYAAVGEDLVFLPKEKVLVEVYPDARSFTTASTLSMKDIENSGTIAICHTNRIMITSPRVILTGYPWLDTLCHEYAHYVVIKKTRNVIPVWLHEGIAKFEEERWRSDRGYELEPLPASLLAEGLKENRLVTFQQMHPSLAKLSHQDAALAYAEAVTVIHFLREKFTPASVVAILDRATQTGDVPGAIADVTKLPFDAFYGQWMAWLRAKNLAVVPGLRSLRPKLKSGMEQESLDLADDVGEKSRQLVLIGDLLGAEDLWDAALIEYDKAVNSCETFSPHIANRVAFAFLSQRQPEKAEPILLKTQRYFPEFEVTYANMGRVFASLKRYEEAARRFDEALRINPFDLLARRDLIEVYRSMNNTELARREQDRMDLVARSLFGETAPKP